MNDELLSRENLGFEEWAVTPSKDDMTPDSVKREQIRKEFLNELEHEPSTIVISHGDADGLGAVAMVKEVEGGEAAFVTVSYHGPYDVADALQDVSLHADFFANVYVTDLGCDDPSVIEAAAQVDQPVHWFDHHQWDNDLIQRARSSGISLTIDEDECATSLIAETFGMDEDMMELAEVTKDHDLWIKEDPRSDRLGVMAYTLDDEAYVESVRENGVDHPEWVEDEIDEQLELDEKLEAHAVERANTWTVRDYKVALTYIRGGRSSEIGNQLVEEHEDDYNIAIVMRPSGCSIYSHSDRETFARCHEVAGELGGGGHPTASGFPIPADTFRQMADYWVSCGESVRDEIVAAISEVVGDE